MRCPACSGGTPVGGLDVTPHPSTTVSAPSNLDHVGRICITPLRSDLLPLGCEDRLDPRSINPARVTPIRRATASERARSVLSTLTEMTLTPRPLRGRPGLRLTFAHLRRLAGD